MMGATHRVLAAGAWLAAAPAVGATGWQAAAGILPAVAFAAGPTSPDLDNTRLAKWVDSVIPGPDPFGHRRLAHWWALPALAGAAVWQLPDSLLRVAALAAVIGWASHLAGDLVFGQGGFGTPQGVPLGPWWWHVGVGVKVGSGAETVTRWALLPAVAWLALGQSGQDFVVAVLGHNT